MGDSPIIEVLIGLVVVYLTLSLVCSAAIEALASGFGWRADTLRIAIGRLLGDSAPSLRIGQKIVRWWFALAQSAWRVFFPPLPMPKKWKRVKLAEAIYSHPFVSALQPSLDRDPAYIPNETFAEVLLDRLTPSSAGSSAAARLVAIAAVVRPQLESSASVAPPAENVRSDKKDAHEEVVRETIDLSPDARIALGKLFERAREKAGPRADASAVLAAFRAEIGRWYQDTMDRASGWYRRHTQVWLFIVATIVVIPTNSDSIEIIGQLAKNPAVRAALVAQGDRLSKLDPASAGGSAIDRETTATLAKELEGAGLQLGWKELPTWSAITSPSQWFQVSVLSKICGLLITIFAVALGAPFWFQVLEKLVKIRASGARIVAPKTADDPDTAAAPKDAGGGAVAVAVGADSSGSSLASASASLSVELEPAYWTARGARASQHPPSRLLAGKPEQLTAESARLSALAYDPEYLLRKRLEMLGYRAPLLIDRRGAPVFVADVPDLGLVVSFRGTEPTKVQDLVADAHVKRVAGSLGSASAPTTFGEVHGGFQQALAYVLADLDAALDARLASSAGKRIVFTGHSLGAALATLYFAHRLALATDRELELVTFGSPRVGDAAFVSALDAAAKKHGKAAITRVVNDRDLVTRVAPRALGFGHLEPVCFLDSAGRIRWGAAGGESWSSFLSTVVDAASDFKKLARGSLEDHSITCYVRKLDAHEGSLT